VRCYWKPRYRKSVLKSAWHPSTTSGVDRCRSPHQARAVVVARWRTPSFRKPGNWISESTFSKPLEWAAGSGCLATEVTWPNSFRLLSMRTYEVPGVCRAVKSRTRVELLSRTMNASAHLRNDKPSLMRWLSRRTTTCKHNLEGHLEQMLHQHKH